MLMSAFCRLLWPELMAEARKHSSKVRKWKGEPLTTQTQIAYHWTCPSRSSSARWSKNLKQAVPIEKLASQDVLKCCWMIKHKSLNGESWFVLNIPEQAPSSHACAHVWLLADKHGGFKIWLISMPVYFYLTQSPRGDCYLLIEFCAGNCVFVCLPL